MSATSKEVNNTNSRWDFKSHHAVKFFEEIEKVFLWLSMTENIETTETTNNWQEIAISKERIKLVNRKIEICGW